MEEKTKVTILTATYRIRGFIELLTDEDVETLKKAGLSEDRIFEATVAAAVGAGLKRLRLGLAVLADAEKE